MRGECAIPLRNFIESSVGSQVAENCSKLNVSWVFGFTISVFVILLVIKLGSKQKHHEEHNHNNNNERPKRYVEIPWWLVLLPLIYFLWYWYSALTQAADSLASEQLMFTESGMKKSEFLSFRAGEDRARMSSYIAACGALFIGSTALFGPFLRGDR